MAIFHFNQGIVQRSKGHSAVAAVAYQSGERITDERTGIVHDFRRKGHVAFTEILAIGAPEFVLDRSRLWNAIEAANRRSDAQTAVTLEFALPVELSLPQWVELTRKFLAPYVQRGQVADVAIHTPSGNPHAHVKLTMNGLELESDGFGKKVREWNPDFSNKGGKQVADADSLFEARRRWADCANDALRTAGLSTLANLSAESYATQGIDQTPTIHQGRTRYIPRDPDTPLDRDTIAAAVDAQRELQRIGKQEQRVHQLIKRFEDELTEARLQLAEVIKPTSAKPTPKPADVCTTAFAAKPGPLPNQRRIVAALDLPRVDGLRNPSIIMPDEFQPH